MYAFTDLYREQSAGYICFYTNTIKCIKDGGIVFAGNWSRFTDECVVQLHTEGRKSAIKKKK